MPVEDVDCLYIIREGLVLSQGYLRPAHSLMWPSLVPHRMLMSPVLHGTPAGSHKATGKWRTGIEADTGSASRTGMCLTRESGREKTRRVLHEEMYKGPKAQTQRRTRSQGGLRNATLSHEDSWKA